MVNLPEGWAQLIATLIIAILIWIFKEVVMKSINSLKSDIQDLKIEIKENNVNNVKAHETIWIEHNATKKEFSERLACVETKIEMEERIKKLLSST